MSKNIFIISFFIIGFIDVSIAQPGDITFSYKLKIYKRNGGILSINDADYVIFPKKYLVDNKKDYKEILYNKKSIKEYKNYIVFYGCAYCRTNSFKYRMEDSLSASLITIIHKYDTMQLFIQTSYTLDSVPFLKGKFIFNESQYESLGDSAMHIIMPEWDRYKMSRSQGYYMMDKNMKMQYKILKRRLVNWENFRVQEWTPYVKESLIQMSISKYYSKE